MGIKPKKAIFIAAPAFPEPMRHIWNWYAEVRAGVQGNGTTYPVITWVELHCWAQLTRQELSPREASTIIALGNLWAGIMGEKKPDAPNN